MFLKPGGENDNEIRVVAPTGFEPVFQPREEKPELPQQGHPTRLPPVGAMVPPVFSSSSSVYAMKLPSCVVTFGPARFGHLISPSRAPRSSRGLTPAGLARQDWPP